MVDFSDGFALIGAASYAARELDTAFVTVDSLHCGEYAFCDAGMHSLEDTFVYLDGVLSEVSVFHGVEYWAPSLHQCHIR